MPVPREQSLVTNCHKWKYHYDKVKHVHLDPKYVKGQDAAQFLLLRFKNNDEERKKSLIVQLAPTW